MIMTERYTEFVSRLKETPTALIGLVLVTLLITVAIFGPMISPYEPTKIHAKNRLEPPSRQFWLGTDQFGRDTFSRIVMGSRTSLSLGIFATLLGTTLGTLIGLLSGYSMGKIDELIMRLMDALMSFPSLLLALLVLTALGSNLFNVIISIGIVSTPRIARVARSVTLSIKNEDYVLAARARGDSLFYILCCEILPNILPSILVEGSIRVGFAIVTGASISYLGMGTQPPTPDWGMMIGQAREYIVGSPWLIIWPALAIAVTVIGFNLLGDGIRDMLDPHLVKKKI
jgi:peptide/nickel transport system permease protein